MAINVDWLSVIAIVAGLCVSFWGLYIVWNGKLRESDPAPATVQEKISMQLKGFSMVLLGILLIPTVGFVASLVGRLSANRSAGASQVELDSGSEYDLGTGNDSGSIPPPPVFSSGSGSRPRSTLY